MGEEPFYEESRAGPETLQAKEDEKRVKRLNEL